MKRDRVAVFVFVDALGFNYLRSHEFLPEFEFRHLTEVELNWFVQPGLLTGKNSKDSEQVSLQRRG
jgi:hypothetical protein